MQTKEQVLAIVWGNILAAGLAAPNVAGNINGDRSRALRVAAEWADLGVAALLTRFNNDGDLIKHLENLPK